MFARLSLAFVLAATAAHRKPARLSLADVRTRLARRSWAVVPALAAQLHARSFYLTCTSTGSCTYEVARLSLAVAPVRAMFARLSTAFVQAAAARTKLFYEVNRLSLVVVPAQSAPLFVHSHAAMGGCSQYNSLIACYRVHSIDFSLSLSLSLLLLCTPLCCCRSSLSLSINFTTHLFIKLSVELAFGFSSLLVSRRYTATIGRAQAARSHVRHFHYSNKKNH